MSNLTTALKLAAASTAILGFAWCARAADEAAKWDPADLAKESTCKICHSKADKGDQFGVWQKSKHAKAFEALKSDKAKEVAKKAGVEDPTTSGKCLKCHSTAYGFTEAKVTDKIAVEEGVTCQTCHGPGDKYKTKGKHDQGIELAKKNGMLVPDANTCARCHNKDNPTDPGNFNFDEKKKEIAHPRPAK